MCYNGLCLQKCTNSFSKKPKHHEVKFKICLCLRCIQAVFIFLIILWILLLNNFYQVICSTEWLHLRIQNVVPVCLVPCCKPRCTPQRTVPRGGILSWACTSGILRLACTRGPGFILQTHAFLLPGDSDSGSWYCWLLESGQCSALPTRNFLSLAHLTSRTFLPEIPLLFFSRFKEMAWGCHYVSNIHCPDLQYVFFDYRISAQLFHVATLSHSWCDLCYTCVSYRFTAGMVCLTAYFSSSVQEHWFSVP